MFLPLLVDLVPWHMAKDYRYRTRRYEIPELNISGFCDAPELRHVTLTALYSATPARKFIQVSDSLEKSCWQQIIKHSTVQWPGARKLLPCVCREFSSFGRSLLPRAAERVVLIELSAMRDWISRTAYCKIRRTIPRHICWMQTRDLANDRVTTRHTSTL